MGVEGNRRRVLCLLADGRFHSGQELAEHLGVTRAAVWKHLKGLRDAYELEIDSVKGRGYRLRAPLDLLEAKRIRAELDAPTAERLGDLVVHDSLDSTNSWLMEQASAGMVNGAVCLAERQTAGRGRHGRGWVSPFGTNVYLSLLWRFELAPVQLTGLSLAAGVAVARALAQVGVADLALKWPNDVLWKRRKLAGLLLEVRGESSGPSHVVAGVGLNTRMPHQDARVIAQPWADLSGIDGAPPISRNRLVALLIGELTRTMDIYSKEGLAPFVGEWSRFDHFRGEQVILRIGSREVRGDYLGIAQDGSIRLRVAGDTVSYNVGEVDLCRPQT
jgi:BirA family biotin operon repressor/biotin-[acetyl-CoA-carboxylase] ligase